jgi:isoleucyl-tRNA synthetase
MENRGDKQEEILVGSVEELYNEIEKSIAAVFKRKSFQRF